MGIVAGLTAAAAATTIGSSIYGMANSGGSGSPTGTYGGNPATYIPTGQPGADALYQNIFNGISPYATSLPGQVIPQIQNNPYAALAQQGSGAAASYAPTLAGYGQGGAASLYGAGNQVLGTAFDPQQALYNQLQQRTVDQSNATNSMYGLSSSPYGAGVTTQALQNFNIDWQNQQLQRQQQGIQSAGQAYSGATNLGGQAATDLSTLSGLPSQTYLGNLNSIISGTNSALGPGESLANLLQSYLGLGQSATGLAQAGQATQFSQNSQLGQNLATALTNPALANLFNSGGGGNSGAYGYNYANTVDAANSGGYYGPTTASGGLLYGG